MRRISDNTIHAGILAMTITLFGLLLHVTTQPADARDIRDQYKGKHWGQGAPRILLEADCPTAQGVNNQLCVDDTIFTVYICSSSTGCLGTGWSAVSVTTNADLTGPVTSIGNATTIETDAIDNVNQLDPAMCSSGEVLERGASVWGCATPSGGGDPVEQLVKFFADNPAEEELFETLQHFTSAATAKSIHCQCRGGGSIEATWKIDGVTVRDTGTGEIVCDAEEEDITLTGDASFDAGQDLDLLLGDRTGTVSDCTFQLTYTLD